MKEIFLVFLKLGCHAFGGPTAHFGYFHETFVKRLKWMSEREYADTMALCQFLPGPSSSQTGFAIGLKRGGVWGGFLAWVGFTAPSAALMILFALGLDRWGDLAGAGWLEGLKLTAMAVVANAAWGMASKLCPDRNRALIAVGSCALLLYSSAAGFQALSIFLGGIVGWLIFRNSDEVSYEADEPASTSGRGTGAILLGLFFQLLIGLPLLASALPENRWFSVADGFYRSGSLVFGGGHVVLPLLQQATVEQGMLDNSTFIAGYGSAQAMPGPLFSFASFLGASLQQSPNGVTGGLFALAMIYLPSWLLVLGGLPFWNLLRRTHAARAALKGANAAVVGLLFAALYEPIWVSAIFGAEDLAFAIIAFALLKFCKTPPWALVLLGAACGALIL